MNRAVLGALAGAALVMVSVCALAPQGEVFAQRLGSESPSGGSGQLIALPGPTDESGQLYTVFDPQMRAISVYHVDGTTGKIVLRSVRNIHWDLQLTSLNNESPLPQEIRSLLQQRQDR